MTLRTITLEKIMDKKKLFELWYGESCTDEEKNKMFEQVNGEYKFMQASQSYGAFCAALELVEPMYIALVKLRDCCEVTLPDRMDGVRAIARDALINIEL
jgi:hypothetical protein